MALSDVSQLLIGIAAVSGPVLVYFSSKRAQREATKQAVGAAAVTETTLQLTSWKEIAERHDADRHAAEEREAKARQETEEERAKRRAAEDERDRLSASNLMLKGVVAGEVGLTASMFPEVGPGASPRPTRNPSSHGELETPEAGATP